MLNITALNVMMKYDMFIDITEINLLEISPLLSDNNWKNVSVRLLNYVQPNLITLITFYLTLYILV